MIQWILENSSGIVVVLLTFIAIILIAVLGHLKSILEEVSFVSEMQKVRNMHKLPEDVNEIKEEISRISLQVSYISHNID